MRKPIPKLAAVFADPARDARYLCLRLWEDQNILRTWFDEGYPETAGCWLVGAPLILFQENMHEFPSELLFARVALAVQARVGADG